MFHYLIDHKPLSWCVLYSLQVCNRVEARFAGLAKWLPGVIRRCSFDGCSFDVQYDNGKLETKVNGSLIRLVTTNGSTRSNQFISDMGSIVRSDSPSPSNGNPFARPTSQTHIQMPSLSPSKGNGVNPFERTPSSPLPSVLKTPVRSPCTTIEKSPQQQDIVLMNWDAAHSSESGSEFPSPFKNSVDKDMSSPILSGRAARTAPGQSRAPDNGELFPEGVLAKKESRRDVRTAGNIPDPNLVKERRPAANGGERRKGARRAAGRVARAVSEQMLAPDATPNIPRQTNRIGPAQILRDARNHSTANFKSNNSMSSITLVEDDDSMPTIFSVNLLETENLKDRTIRKRDK